MNTEQEKGKQQENEKPENFVHVAVITTAGSYPTEFEKVPNHQKIDIFLKKAIKELNIVSAENWVAKVENKELQVTNSYLENNLSGEISIDFGPREGGGGNE